MGARRDTKRERESTKIKEELEETLSQAVDVDRRSGKRGGMKERLVKPLSVDKSEIVDRNP